MLNRDGRIQASAADLDKPERHTVGLLDDDLPTAPSAPNSLDTDFASLNSAVDTRAGSMPAGSVERPLPQPKPQTENGMTPEELAEWRAERAQRQMAERAEVVQAQIAQQFISTTKDFKPTPANASLLAETMRAHNLPMTVENLRTAWESVRFAADNKQLDEYTVAELKAADAIEWPAPPTEMLQAAAPAPTPQPQPKPQQPITHPPCASCGAAYEQHVNGQCPNEVRPDNWSYGLPERSGLTPQPEVDLNDPQALAKLAQQMAGTDINSARQIMISLMARARQGR
jgi:hypothetical protein